MIKCPYCGESYYSEGVTTSTALYYQPIFKNGVMLDSGDENYHTTQCHCLSCGKNFLYTRYKGETHVSVETKM